jgi:hypothetical protein
VVVLYRNEQRAEALQNTYSVTPAFYRTPSGAGSSIGAVVPDHNRFHHETQRVSENLLRDGRYKQAPIKAYIRVIERVTPD